MDATQFLSQCLLLDLEADDASIHRIGAVWQGKVFECRGRFDVGDALRQLDAFAAPARFVLGHNLIDHDLPILSRLYPGLLLLSKPVIDTLFLSPLAFPENPYHRLVKDYKLVREALSDPVADAQLAGSVFTDQWQSFTSARQGGQEQLLGFYRACFERSSAWSLQGLALPFAALGVPALAESDWSETLRALVGRQACTVGLERLLSRRDPEIRTALAYAVAWLQVAGANSVLPPWVRHRFPEVIAILHELRDGPCTDPTCRYCRETHDSGRQLKRFFGFESFREKPVCSETGQSLQQEIVECGLRDEPLLAILPTGGGKSLCYQLPALVRHWRRGLLTIVISPLQALMKDQVDNLIARTGVPAVAAVNGLLTAPERGEVLDRVRLGDIALLYAAPEQLRNRSFVKAISQREIGCWVFDEAHCLSKWGHDFRPDYLYAGRFIRELAGGGAIPPVACYTATAKRDVQQEIVDYFDRELGQKLHVFEGGVERDNLSFEVQLVSQVEKVARIQGLIEERMAGGSAIVYTATRAGAEAIAAYLRQRGGSAAAFHAGLTAPEKRLIQEAFVGGEIPVICATNAFGMGIDKENVRLVIHADIPGSLENYLQEAGRAGRDMGTAQCVLLYDPQDAETQFRLQAGSELSRADIGQLLRGLRRARRSRANAVVITAGELLRDEEVRPGFDSSDFQAETKVKAAVAWLERSGFLERNENDTRIFQGRPIVQSLAEAQARIGRLNLAPARQRCWLEILKALFNAKINEGMSADELAELPGVRGLMQEQAERAETTETQEVLRTLHAMTQAGLIRQSVLLSAYLRLGGAGSARALFAAVCNVEEGMLRIMQEQAPDAASQGWLDLSMRRLNQRLIDAGFSESNPRLLMGLLRSLSYDGRGLAGNRGSLDLRPIEPDHYRVKLQRDWEALRETANRRRLVAKTLLEVICTRAGQASGPKGEILVDFSSDDLLQALQANVYLAGCLKDPLAAMDRGLMFLHEHRAITLQHGLAVFRQAMTIRLPPEMLKRRYAKADYLPLSWHYAERIFQIHVMNEYARLGAEKIRLALELVLAYFSLDKAEFIKRFFPGRKQALERATSQESYRGIVEDLRHPVQAQIVTAPDEENLLVLAGPGSGKTRVVVHRCAYLLRVRRIPARSILVLCFNRNAAVSLRRRLFELVGPDARGVAVQTYHGLAMRLTGTSLAQMAEANDPACFDRLIVDAIALLRGEKPLLGIEPDELRDQLLAGYRFILVDEYQDIDQAQYDLISALAGRTEADREHKLSILAVGDDDQNIYTFRGANVAFIRRFQEDYRATVHHLVENFRSSAPIIAASNALIARNRDRMKTEHPIRMAAARARSLPSAAPVAVIEVADGTHQALTLARELERLKGTAPAFEWSKAAVLARNSDELSPIRSVCEARRIPLSLGLSREKSPALHRIREVARFIAALRDEGREALCTGTELSERLHALSLEPEANPWMGLLSDFVGTWREESADVAMPVPLIVEALFEALAEQRREQRLGTGVFLATAHAAKGMEFDHVLVADGGWYPGKDATAQEEERRVLYVAMTRARQTLTLFSRSDTRNPHLAGLQGVQRHREDPWIAPLPPMHTYETLGLQDIYVDFASRFPSAHRTHEALASLRPGSLLYTRPAAETIELTDAQGIAVSRLSTSRVAQWRSSLDQIEQLRVIGLIERTLTDVNPAYLDRCRCDRWQAPWIEAVYKPA